jgi:hypothetical protein
LRFVTLHDFYAGLADVPDGCCVVLDDLWLVSNPSVGGCVDQILMLLAGQCVLVLIAKPFSNIPVFYSWLSNVRPSQPRVIEAPFERCPPSYFVLSERPWQLTLVRNSALPLDTIALAHAMAAAMPGFCSEAAMTQTVDYLLANGLGPVLIVVPTKCCFPACITSKNRNIEDAVKKFEADDRGVLCVTTKVVESLFIPTHSIIVSCLFKFDGRVCREMQPSEFYHIVRSTGRPGVDTQGIVVTCLFPSMSLSFLTNTLIADLPWLIPHFQITSSVVVTARTCHVEDLDEFAVRTFSGFCQSQVLPILRDQLSHLSSSVPPREVGEVCLRMSSIETAISTLCTHPMNIRRLLVNGRVIRVRPPIAERPWGICFGSSTCGTVTVAMKGVLNKRRVDCEDNCLVTVPISEVLAISAIVKQIPRQLLRQEVDRSPAALDLEYPLYDGDELVVGGDKLHQLHREWKSLPKIDEKWREIAELVFKQSYVAVRVEVMSKPLKGRFRQPDLAAPQQFLDVMLRLGVVDFIAAASLLTMVTDWDEIEAICAWVVVIEGGVRREGAAVSERVRRLWRSLESVGEFEDGCLETMAAVEEWIGEEVAKVAVESWTVGCIVKRIYRAVMELGAFERQNGRQEAADKLDRCKAIIAGCTNFLTYFG